MATYLELYDIVKDVVATTDLHRRVVVATAVKASLILDEATPSQTRKDWALKALQNPEAAAEPLFHYALADNSGASQAAILAADDATIQSAVNAAVDALYP